MKPYSVVLLALLVAVPAEAQSDTTFNVVVGARLRVRNERGSVVIDTWARDQIRVEAEYERRGGITITDSRTTVRIEAQSRRGPAEVEMNITIPRWMAVEVAGTFADIEVRDVDNDVSIEVTHGDVTIDDVGGDASVQATNGDITVRRVGGRVDLSSINGEIEVEEVTGDLDAETLNGDVALRGLQSTVVRVYTLNGDVRFEGAVSPAGRYRFETHNGDVDLAVPSEIDASVTISTAQGEFVTRCPVRISRTFGGGKQFEFTIGEGTATIEVQSFGGTISLEPRGACWSV